MKKSQSFFPSLLFAALLLVCACFAHAQVYPFMSLGNAQFFDNNGKPLTAGVLYSYQAGTSTQQATYTDSTGISVNPNPIPFGSGARVSIWLSAASKYKFVLCLQNDGAACAPADVLFSVDQVPACPGCSIGGNIFTGTFISGSPNPATTGILELASTDALCWRNQASTANLCITKDTSDVLGWAGGTIKFPEGVCAATAANFDYLCASSLHRWMMSNNLGVYGAVPTIPTAIPTNHLPSATSTGYDLQDSGGTAPGTTAVTFSATPTFTATWQDQLFTMTLTGNVTSSTLTMTSLPTPSVVSFELTQDATGGRTFAWPANVINPPIVASAANALTFAQFLWDGTNARLVGPAACNTQTKTAAYALLATDCVIQASVAGGNYTLQIPHLVSGVVWEITRTDTSANTLTVAADSGNVNGAASFHLPPNGTTICHADGTNVWCTLPGVEYTQSTTLTGSATTWTYPVPYSSTPNCLTTGYGGTANIATCTTTGLTLSTLTVATNAVMVSGKP